MTSAALGATLEEIAAKGAKGFYEGRVAEDIVATLKAKGGLMSARGPRLPPRHGRDAGHR
jgi:gamma-glutamyltranspeptidase/glutathione hydrolase